MPALYLSLLAGTSLVLATAAPLGLRAVGGARDRSDAPLVGLGVPLAGSYRRSESLSPAGPANSVDVLLCTFRRPQVGETLASLAAQQLPDGLGLRIVVADNDDTPSGKAAVEAAAAGIPHEVIYLHAPARNISIARNACLDAATSRWIAFIDDDETAAPDWLARLHACLVQSGADAAFGPVHALYGSEAPDWMREQDHHSNIPVRRDGEVATGHSCNAMLRWRDTPGRPSDSISRSAVPAARTPSSSSASAAAAHATRLPRTRGCPNRSILGGSISHGCGGASSAWGRPTRSPPSGCGPGHCSSPAAAAKAGYCVGRAALRLGDRGASNFWLLRGALHAGVCAGCLAETRANLYGE